MKTTEYYCDICNKSMTSKQLAGSVLLQGKDDSKPWGISKPECCKSCLRACRKALKDVIKEIQKS